MSLNHEEPNSPKRENYLNGGIDFTDCIDFTNQYQKSCSAGENEAESAYQSSASSITDKDYFTGDNKHNEFNRVGEYDSSRGNKSSSNENNEGIQLSSQDGARELDNDSHPMEPDVSITVGESNLEKTINHVAKGSESKDNKVSQKQVNGGLRSRVIKKKSVYGKKNHLKLGVNKNIKKKVSVLKCKSGKLMKRKNESFQYQGLQSHIKFKCYKCSVPDFSSITELQTHQRKCISSSQEFQSINESTSFSNPNSSNFKITRKVYLCSACGSYYENWNLFLHMKEMHKRHICLYCLGMFSQPDKLAQHLITKHNVVEQSLSSTEDFFKLYRGTCYLICCTCEAMFSEQEEFYEHSCTSYSLTDESGVCPLCGLQGTHYPNCRRTLNDRRIDSNKSLQIPEKRFYNKKKKLKTSKKSKDVFKIINNENGGEMSVTVRKQNLGEENKGAINKDQGECPDTSPLRLSNEDLVSTKQYNEKMLQLYRPNKTTEKVISSIQSIEDSINRVVENLGAYKDEDEEEEDDIDDGDIYETSGVDDVNSTANNTVPAAGDEDLKVGEPNECHKIETDSTTKINEIDKREDNQKNHEQFEDSKVALNGNGVIKKNEKQVLSDDDSTDSEKLTIAFDQPYESGNDKNEEKKTDNDPVNRDNACEKLEDSVPTAGADIPYVHVTLKDGLEDDKALIKELVKESWNCVYCAHAKRIAVNGKQLSLHILAEHRFVTCPEDSTEEEKSISALKVVQRLKNSLSRLELCYFNTDTFDSEDKSFWKPNDRMYECFHCLFATYVHKELHSHNRKMHQKAVFLCIMCKSNFYNYSELLCHLCPGIYIPGKVINPDITYRCFLCDVDPLPSSFRLMVHLRRRHNSCDICFDQSANQFQLSTHVWKHKLSHMCYRCGIAYRNKPDITKHLFWKHGTESVLCKKCLQKKWPHVYHFCVPPNSFICDECSVTLKSAVALKVHKRIHSGEYPYICDKCEEKFISRKLLAKHMEVHEEKEKADAPNVPEIEEKEQPPVEDPKLDEGETKECEKKQEKEKKSKKRKVITDVFDLPPVNLSESDDSDQDIVSEPKIMKEKTPEPEEPPSVANVFLNGELQKEEPVATQIVDGVWNNFKNYMDRKEFPKTFRPASPFKNMSLSRIKAIMLSDHDYHIIPNSNQQDSNLKSGVEKEEEKAKVGLDHDYCNNNSNANSKSTKTKIKTKHKEERSRSSSSESSSDSDSSCSCGSNCSCSSGSSSSTSSNDSDSDSRGKRKEKKKVSKEAKVTNKVESVEPTADTDISVHDVTNENIIHESDLETEETDTDEDFYDYNPAREANRILAEKRTQLLANLNGSDTFASSPSTPTEKAPAPKKKSKIKKKRSQSRMSATPKTNRKKTATATSAVTASSAVVTPSLNNSILGANGTEGIINSNGIYEAVGRVEDGIHNAGDSDAKRPKRKRVPLKFYGFSSDEEGDSTPASRKRDKGEHNTTTPAVHVPVNPAADPISDVWNSKWRVEKSESVQQKVNPIKIRTSLTMKQNTHLGSAANSEFFQVKRPDKSTVQVNGSGSTFGSAATASAVTTAAGTGQKGEKLYCFCQCPYDEVSEMIACDAEDCVIEWFHFECVGIMVPPKGSWYCPDCRKKFAAENEFMSPPVNEQNVM